MTLNEIYLYNQFNENVSNLLEVLNYNRHDIELLIKDLPVTKIDYISIQKVRKQLKKKSKEFVIKRSTNIGNLYTFGANIDEKDNTFTIIALPYGDYKDKSLAKIHFNKPKSRNVYKKIEQLIISLRSNKVRFNYSINKIIELNVVDIRDNEKFWSTVKLWSSR
jgi:hypothetical protein